MILWRKSKQKQGLQHPWKSSRESLQVCCLRSRWGNDSHVVALLSIFTLFSFLFLLNSHSITVNLICPNRLFQTRERLWQYNSPSIMAWHQQFSIAGDWAYGSAVSEYLPYQLSGRKCRNQFNSLGLFAKYSFSTCKSSSILLAPCYSWSLLMHLTSCPRFQMFRAPNHEALDPKFQKLDEGIDVLQNQPPTAILFASINLWAKHICHCFVSIHGGRTLSTSSALQIILSATPFLCFLKRHSEEVFMWQVRTNLLK